MSLPSPSPIREISLTDEAEFSTALLASNQPLVLRGLVNHWPLVERAKSGSAQAVEYLRQFANDRPVQAFVAPAEVKGRYFYNEAMDGFNFSPKTTTLNQVLDALLNIDGAGNEGSTYLGSTAIDHILPGLRKDNEIKALSHAPLVSIWIGNQSRIAAHYDVPDNIACNIAGQRRFTLFPPDQIDNLYVGPLDFTPAGQSASLVDFHQPDLQRFPKFATAMEYALTAELAPGDGIFIPSMWWHHVEGLASFNLLINYWWRQVPDYLGTPLDALNHALLSIRDLPAAQREVWRNLFDHYVFSPAENGHIPAQRRGVLNPLDEIQARKLRATLINKLNR